MRRFAAAGVLATLALILAATGAVASGNGTSVNGGGSKDGLRAGKTDLPSPQGLKQRELVKEAVQLKLQGKLAKDGAGSCRSDRRSSWLRGDIIPG